MYVCMYVCMSILSSAFRCHWPVEFSGVIDLNLRGRGDEILRGTRRRRPARPGLGLLRLRHLQANFATCLLRLLQALTGDAYLPGAGLLSEYPGREPRSGASCPGWSSDRQQTAGIAARPEHTEPHVNTTHCPASLRLQPAQHHLSRDGKLEAISARRPSPPGNALYSFCRRTSVCSA